jgi:hypothetical protein
LEQASGLSKTISQPREHAADAFNAGKMRFLVSTGKRRGGSFAGTFKDCGSVLEKSATA